MGNKSGEKLSHSPFGLYTIILFTLFSPLIHTIYTVHKWLLLGSPQWARAGSNSQPHFDIYTVFGVKGQT